MNTSAKTCRFLVLCDVDSTLIDQEVIDELADGLGLKAEVAAITESAMRGELDFSESLRRRVALLSGLPRSEFLQVFDRITVTEGAQELVDAVHAHGGLIFAVSGGFYEILDLIGAKLGLDGWHANRLGGNNITLDGTVDGEIVDAELKATLLKSLTEKFGLSKQHTIAVGDGANDIAMIQEAGLGIAFHAKPALKEAANLVIPTRDLSPIISVLP